MTVVDLAERKSRLRAGAFYFFAVMILATLWFSFGPGGVDFFQGLWLGITLGAALNLLPLKRWLRPKSQLARLLDDATVRDHRRPSWTVGFWAAGATALCAALATHDAALVSPFDVARLIATAAVVAALVAFATLELRAARG